MATFIEAADLHMKDTHFGFVSEFAQNEDLFFEEYDRAHEKVISQSATWRQSDRLSPAPQNNGLRSLINDEYAYQ